MHVQDEDVIHSGIFLHTVHAACLFHSTLHPRHVFLLCFTSLELTAAFTSHCSLCKAHINMPSCAVFTVIQHKQCTTNTNMMHDYLHQIQHSFFRSISYSQ